MQPFVVERLDHIVLRVRDLERSIAFYRDVLGCVVVKWRDDLELAHLRLGTSMLDLVAVSGALGREGGAAPGGEGRNLDHFCVRIEPFDEAALVAHLEGFGLVPQVPAEIRFGAEGDGWSLYFFDPDGNRVELKGPRVDSPARGKGPAPDRGAASARSPGPGSDRLKAHPGMSLFLGLSLRPVPARSGRDRRVSPCRAGRSRCRRP